MQTYLSYITQSRSVIAWGWGEVVGRIRKDLMNVIILIVIIVSELYTYAKIS